jgi:putative CocE/NonD family hydrolase
MAQKQQAVVVAAPAPLDPQRLIHRRALQVGEEGPWRPATAPQPLAWRLHSTGLAAVRCDEGLLVAEARWRSASPDPGRAATALPGPEQATAPLRSEDRRGSAPGGAGAAGGSLLLVHDPWRPVPGRGGHLGLDAGLVSREDLDRRADVACFTSAPLTDGLRLEGVPQLVIAVEADQPGFDLCAALSLLTPEGRAWQLSSGVARFLGDHCLRLRRRRLQLQPLLRELRPGQRLRLSLAAAAWPQIGVNPGDGSPWAGAVSPAHRPITLRFDLCLARLWMSSMFGAN